MTYRQLIRILEDNGCQRVRSPSGSHVVYERMTPEGRRVFPVAVSRLGADVAPGTLAAIIRQSGLPRELFRR